MNLKQAIKDKYYRYEPGEFLPVYSGGEMLNKSDFHKYRVKWLLTNREAAFYQFTHYSS